MTNPTNRKAAGEERRSCGDCAHVVASLEDWCAAPQLAHHLDTSAGHQNAMTPCEGVRDFKHACGHAARWFVPRADREQGNAG